MIYIFTYIIYTHGRGKEGGREKERQTDRERQRERGIHRQIQPHTLKYKQFISLVHTRFRV